MFQYVTVKLPNIHSGPRSVEEAWTDRINAVAAEGWRLVTVAEVAGKGFTTNYATFEREVAP